MADLCLSKTTKPNLTQGEVMKKMGLLVMGLMMSAATVQANVGNTEFPMLGARNMEITRGRDSFENVRRVDLVLYGKFSGLETSDGLDVVPSVLTPSAIDVYLFTNQDMSPRKTRVQITSTEKDSCGSVTYHANFSTGEGPATGARFSVSLTDHSARVCRDYHPFLWEAHVRSGFGWCGTMDETMELKGNPQPLLRQ